MTSPVIARAQQMVGFRIAKFRISSPSVLAVISLGAADTLIDLVSREKLRHFPSAVVTARRGERNYFADFRHQRTG